MSPRGTKKGEFSCYIARLLLGAGQTPTIDLSVSTLYMVILFQQFLSVFCSVHYIIDYSIRKITMC